MTWRPKELFTEALRNLGPTHLGVGLVLTFLLTVFGLLTFDQARTALEQEWGRQDLGGLVWLAAATPEAPLDGTTCESLNRYGGVAAAGGTTLASAPSVRTLPQTPSIPTKGITPNALKVWATTSSTTGVILGVDLEQLGVLSVGSRIQDSNGNEATVQTRTAPTVRPDQFTSHLLVISQPNQPLLDCWIRMEPGAVQHGEEILKYAFGSVPGAQIKPYLSSSSGSATPGQQWHSFADKVPWIPSAALLALVLAFGVWSRRTELAIYQAFGSARSIVAALISIETVLIVVPALAAAVLLTVTLAAVTVHSPLGADTVSLIWRTLTSTALLGFALGTPLAVLATTGRVTDQLKDR